MAAIQLSSTNPDLTYVISKNPATGIILKQLRKGTAFGWFSNKNTSYNILFKDAPDEVSYSKYEDSEFEYLDTTRYSCPMFITNAINEFLHTASKKQHENDVPGVFESSFLLNNINIQNDNFLKFFENHFKGVYNFESFEISKGNYNVKITTSETIISLVNFTYLFAIFISVINGENVSLQPDLIEKCLNIINDINAPYFIRYLFKVRFLPSKNSYDRFKNRLEKSESNEIKFTFGDNHCERLFKISNILTSELHNYGKSNIIDIGCGEGRYITRLAQEITDYDYFAIDTDEEVLNRAINRCRNKGIENVIFYDNLDRFIDISNNDDEVYSVILTEVIEHMPMDKAKNLVKKVIQNINFNTIIITTPDKTFNKHYFDEGKRHEDHDFELDKAGFKRFIEKCIGASKVKLSIEFVGLGDEVDGVSTSQMCIIRKKK